MLGEEYYERRDELTNKEKDLYELIVFHTFQNTGLCSKTIPEICEIWNLDYHNTMRRYKVLRGEFREKLQKNVIYKSDAQSRKDKLKTRIENMKSPYLVEEKDGIRPLVGIIWASQQETVKITLARIAEQKSVKVTPESVKTTLPIYKDSTKHYQSIEVHTAHSEAEIAAVCATSEIFPETQNGHKSKFTLEEIFRYVEICKKEGEPITNPAGLATSLYRTGSSDFLIEMKLNRAQAKQTELLSADERKQLLRFCPFCSGSGFDQGRPCAHAGLGSSLSNAVELGEIGADLVSLYFQERQQTV